MKTQPSIQHAPPQNSPLSRRLGMGAFSISLLVHGLFALVAALFLYKWVYPPEPGVIVTGPEGGSPSGEAATKVKTQPHLTIPVSLAKEHQIKTDGPATFSLPETSPDLPDAPLPMSGA